MHILSFSGIQVAHPVFLGVLCLARILPMARTRQLHGHNQEAFAPRKRTREEAIAMLPDPGWSGEEDDEEDDQPTENQREGDRIREELRTTINSIEELEDSIEELEARLATLRAKKTRLDEVLGKMTSPAYSPTAPEHYPPPMPAP